VCHCPCHSDLHHDRPSDFEEDHFLTYIAISFLWLMDGIQAHLLLIRVRITQCPAYWERRSSFE
jgi:hypothetical protein